MTKRLFDVSIDYREHEEAIEYILNEEGDPGVSYDLVAIPLDPSILTDKREGDKDDVLKNVIPCDIPGRVEVFENRNVDEWDMTMTNL